MEGQSGCKNFLELMTWNFWGNVNNVSDGVGGDPNQQLLTVDGRSENQPSAPPLLPLFHCPSTPENYFEFLTENSTFLEKASTADVLGSIPPLVSGTHIVEELPEIQTEFLYNNPGIASGSKPADYSLNMDARMLKSNSYMLNSGSHEALLNERCPKPHSDREPVNRFESSYHENHAQSHNSWTQEPSEDIGNASQIHPGVKVDESVFLSKPQYNVSSNRAATTDRQRRLRIAERLKALQELLPHSVEGSQVAVMNDIIDHIKYLQLQMKELSRSRLRGESTSSPLVFLEGYGHYVVHDQMMNEPLEEMMGKLLEENPSAAMKLLESKGLFMVPMTIADRLQLAI